MSYDLTIQPRGPNTAAVDKERVESFVGSLPGVRRDGPKAFAYTGGKGTIFMSIYIDDAPKVEGISISVPAAFTGTSGEAALLLCFQIADHLGWGVFDEQLGDFLEKDALRQVLRRQQKYGRSEEEVLRRRASGASGFWDCFLGYEILHHRKASVLISLVLAVTATVLLALYVRGYARSDYLVPLSFVFIWGFLLGVKAVVVALWKTRFGVKGPNS